MTPAFTIINPRLMVAVLCVLVAWLAGILLLIVAARRLAQLFHAHQQHADPCAGAARELLELSSGLSELPEDTTIEVHGCVFTKAELDRLDSIYAESMYGAKGVDGGVLS